MTNYLELSIKYLKINKKRTWVSIIGTAITAFILFSLLNTFEGTWLLRRDKIRAEGNYEIVLMTETEEQVEAVISDGYVKSAYVGEYYHLDAGGKYYGEGYYDFSSGEYVYDTPESGTDTDDLPEGVSLIPNATFINTTSPYRMLKLRDYFADTYGVEADVNEELCYSYFQPYGLGVGMLAAVLLISIIIAIMGVGIVRNTIQISIIEQIRDYGNLRCIGATKKQVRYIILCEGFIIESVGILLGCGVSMILSKGVGYFLAPILSTIVNETVSQGDSHLGPHLLPMIPVFVAFYYDLFFLMRENAKLVTGISPVDAIRGNIRVKLPRIKRRKSGLIGKVFGVAGDYAYKNIRRNNRRFLRTTGAIIFGIAVLVATLGAYLYNSSEINNIKKMYGRYPVSISLYASPDITYEDYVASMPDVEEIKTIQDNDLIQDTKPIYLEGIMLADSTFLRDKIRDDAKVGDSNYSYLYNAIYSKVGADNNRDQSLYEYMSSTVSLKSYDQEDMQYLSGNLIEGTMDVSSNGVIVVNGIMASKVGDDLIADAVDEMLGYDFKVGDKIEIVNPQAMEEAIIDEGLEASRADSDQDDDQTEDVNEKYNKIMELRDRLVDEGETIELTVEGVLSVNTLYQKNDIFPEFILPQENFYELTGLSENDVRGYMFSTKRDIFGSRVSSDDIESIGNIIAGIANESADSPVALDFSDLFIASEIKLFSRILGFIMAFAVMLTFVNFLNIMNINASSIALRRKEFAQLRAIGISEKDLRRMIMLEGVLQGLIAGLSGGIIGWAAYIWLHKSILIYMFGESNVVLWPMIIVVTVVTTAVLCISVHMQIKRMNMNLAEDLMASE